jgi:hypothetical protein
MKETEKQFACTSLGYMVMGGVVVQIKIASKVRGKRIMQMVLLLVMVVVALFR